MSSPIVRDMPAQVAIQQMRRAVSVHQVINRRMSTSQQMRRSITGAQRLLQTRLALLDDRLQTHFHARFPHFRFSEVLRAQSSAHSPSSNPVPCISFFDIGHGSRRGRRSGRFQRVTQ